MYDYASLYDLSRIEIQIVEASNPSVSSVSGEKSANRMLGGTWLVGGTKEAVESGAWSTPPTSSLDGLKGKSAKYATRILP